MIYQEELNLPLADGKIVTMNLKIARDHQCE